MSKTSNPQSQKRFQESLASLFVPLEDFKGVETSLIFLKSSSDEGVMRNGGRNGARYAPQSFLSHFKKLTQNDKLKNFIFAEAETASPAEEMAEFHSAQVQESERISTILKAHPKARVCHLGGGHDHVYPLLKAYSGEYKKIVVLNLDAHADTRDDETFHSGTPFRQFAHEFEGEFHLFQVGLHPFANSFSTLSPLKKGSHHILWRNELNDSEKLTPFFQKIKHLIDEKTLVLFSLDADALDGSIMPGVSAVNGDGLDKVELNFLWEKYLTLSFEHPPILGIYELNPVFDTLSMASMRTLGNFLFNTLSK
mgnify:CR=1 FL=1